MALAMLQWLHLDVRLAPCHLRTLFFALLSVSSTLWLTPNIYLPPDTPTRHGTLKEGKNVDRAWIMFVAPNLAYLIFLWIAWEMIFMSFEVKHQQTVIAVLGIQYLNFRYWMRRRAPWIWFLSIAWWPYFLQFNLTLNILNLIIFIRWLISYQVWSWHLTCMRKVLCNWRVSNLHHLARAHLTN